MAGFRERDKQRFPLKCLKDVVHLFRDHVDDNEEPDLTLLSILLGAVESYLTINRTVSGRSEGGGSRSAAFPVLPLATVEALYERFVAHVKGSVDLTQFDSKYATREFVKKVSDVVWNALVRSYHKDKAHLQSLYSYLTGRCSVGVFDVWVVYSGHKPRVFLWCVGR